MLARAGGERGQRLAAGRRHSQSIGAAVVARAPARHQATPHQILDDRGQARLVAAVGMREFGLADARIARDQRQCGKTPGVLADFLRTAREGLERRLLRHAQVEADPAPERTEIDRYGNGFAILAAPHTLLLFARRHHRLPHRTGCHNPARHSWISNYILYNAADMRLNIDQVGAESNINRGEDFQCLSVLPAASPRPR